MFQYFYCNALILILSMSNSSRLEHANFFLTEEKYIEVILLLSTYFVDNKDHDLYGQCYLCQKRSKKKRKTEKVEKHLKDLVSEWYMNSTFISS